MNTEAKRAILYAWDGEPFTECYGDSPQQLAENIGSEIHQAMVADGDLSEIRVQLMDDVLVCPGCEMKEVREATDDWVELDALGGDYVSMWCPKCGPVEQKRRTDLAAICARQSTGAARGEA